MTILKGHCVDLIMSEKRQFDLIATDPPYSFGGTGKEHELSASVAVCLREAAGRLKPGRWMLVMCASSWRSTIYMVEALRGVLQPIRLGHWCKPIAISKVNVPGWTWASVNVIVFRKGRSQQINHSKVLDHIFCDPIKNGRRAELPPQVADWMVQPYAVEGGLMLDPFCGSGAILKAAEGAGMESVGYEL